MRHKFGNKLNFEIQYKLTKYSRKTRHCTSKLMFKIIMIFELLKCNEGAANEIN